MVISVGLRFPRVFAWVILLFSFEPVSLFLIYRATIVGWLNTGFSLSDKLLEFIPTDVISHLSLPP